MSGLRRVGGWRGHKRDAISASPLSRILRIKQTEYDQSMHICKYLALACLCYASGGCASFSSTSPVDFDFARVLCESEGKSEAAYERFVDSFDENTYRQDYAIGDLERDFPVRAGMTLTELDLFLKDNNQQLTHITDLREIFNFDWEVRHIDNGDGWIYFWVNGKSSLHINLRVQNDLIRSVWVMPGNHEVVTCIYYRISGHGDRCGPNTLYPKE